jgi:hypothetical protein
MRHWKCYKPNQELVRKVSVTLASQELRLFIVWGEPAVHVKLFLRRRMHYV